MKKILSTALIIFMLHPVCFADAVCGVSSVNKLAHSRYTPIEDDLVKSKAFPKIMPEYVKNQDPIVDDIVVPYSKSGKVLKIWARKDGERYDNIDDELVDPEFITKYGNDAVLRHEGFLIEDNFAKRHAPLKKARRITVKTNYDFAKKQIPVQLKVIKDLTTKHKILEGDEILFKTVKEININGSVLPKGTKVIGRVETISESDKMGTPAGIIIDNFYVQDDPSICFYGRVSKTGANRSIWVYPLYQAGNVMFYVAGFVFVPIHGGHAKLLTSDTYTVFYESGVSTNPQ